MHGLRVNLYVQGSTGLIPQEDVVSALQVSYALLDNNKYTSRDKNLFHHILCTKSEVLQLFIHSTGPRDACQFFNSCMSIVLYYS